MAITIKSVHEREHAHVRVIAFDLALAFAHTLARALSIALDRPFRNEIESKIDLAIDLARTTTPLTGFDHGLYYAWSYATLFTNESLDRTDPDWRSAKQTIQALMEGSAGLAEEGGLATLAQQLLTMSLLAPSADRQAWQHYADALFTILCNERDLGYEWDFTDEALNKLHDYFYANTLLVECLKVAAVSDRQSILNGLLLPPDTNEQAKKTRRQGDRKRRR